MPRSQSSPLSLASVRLALALPIAGCGGAPATPPAAPAIVLTDVTQASGLPAAANRCLVFRDFTSDGRPDLLLADGGDGLQFAGALGLYENAGDGTFTRHAIPLPELAWVRHCAAADFDNDGFVDLAVGGSHAGAPGLVILRNDGTSGYGFTDVTGAATAALPTETGPFVEALGFADLDGDGFVDLLAGFGLDVEDPLTTSCDATDADFQCSLQGAAHVYEPVLLHNDRGSWGGAPFAPSPAHFVNAFDFVDWDGDGEVDVFQSNDFDVNALYRGPITEGAAGPATDLLPAMGAAVLNHGMGAAFADFDRDGRLDLYVADAGPDQLYLRAADGTVTNAAARLGVADATRLHVGWSPVAEDFDNDGWVDVAMANAAAVPSVADLEAIFTPPWQLDAPSAGQGDYVLRNRQGAGFDRLVLPNPTLLPAPAAACAAVADFDGDGRLDLVTVAATASATVHLYRNESPEGGAHWIDVRLVAKTGNRDAIGALVELHDGQSGGELDRRAVFQGGPGNGWGVVHFGLGASTTVPSITVSWPGGATQTISPDGIDRAITIHET